MSNMNSDSNMKQENLTGPSSIQRTTGILVTLLLLERDAITKTTDRRKQYIGGLLTVLEELIHDYHGRSHGAGAVAKNVHLLFFF